jgi:hypothetical protein
MIWVTLYGLPVLSKECEETNGRYALYQTFVYFMKEVLKRERTRRVKERTAHVKNGCDEPVEKDDGEANVGRSPPWNRKRRAIVGDLTPVKGEDTHGQAVGDAKQLIDLDIVGSHPADPREARQGSEEI